MNPKATLHMANGSKIVIELLPEHAHNTVNSFLHVAAQGLMDNHAIQRIVPGNWVDVSYTAFGKKEAQYLIPNEFQLNPQVVPLDSHPGVVCMGGYGEAGLASCEFFFPLRDCPDHKGTYPVWRAWRRSGGWRRWRPFPLTSPSKGLRSTNRWSLRSSRGWSWSSTARPIPNP